MCSQPLNLWMCSSGKNIRFGLASTACWRRYIGTWKVIDGWLYMVGISAIDEFGKDLSIGDLFPGYNNHVFAHWYSGEVRCPSGKILNYVHGGYASTYERDMFLTFSKGVLIAERIVVNGASDKSIPQGYRVDAFTTYPPKEGC